MYVLKPCIVPCCNKYKTGTHKGILLYIIKGMHMSEYLSIHLSCLDKSFLFQQQQTVSNYTISLKYLIKLNT